MKRKLWMSLVWGLALSGVEAASLVPAGVLGNSGVEGKSLLRTNVDRCGPQEGGGFIDGKSPSGAWIDARTGLWAGRVNEVSNISLGGRLIENHLVTPPGSRIDSYYFTAIDGTLYFFAHDTQPVSGSDYSIYALPMEPGAEAQPFFKTPGIPSLKNAVLCPQPVDGKLMYGSYDEKGFHLELLDLATKESAPLFSLPDGEDLKGLAYDKERKRIFIGGYFGRKDPARLGHVKVYELLCLDLEGKTRWRCGEYYMEGLGANDYYGVLSLACGAIWDSSWAGLFGRRNLEGETAPGKLSFEGKIEHSTQFLDVREALGQGLGERGKDLLLVASPDYSALYFATWDKAASKFELLRRVGCLPGVKSLNMGPDGRISLSSIRYPWDAWVLAVSQCWWNWDDAADSPPDEASFHYGTTNGFYDKDGNLYVLANPYPWNTNSLMQLLKPGGTIEPAGPLPFQTPGGLTVTSIGGAQFAFATDIASRSIWKCAFGKNGEPSKKWEKVDLGGTLLQQTGDIVAIQDGMLAVADKGQVLAFDVTGGSAKLLRTLKKWGNRPDEILGENLCIAADGGVLMVSDTDRQRVLAFRGADFGHVASFGQTDVAGDDLYHLSNPGKVAIRSGRIAISDYGNQRILKCFLQE